MKLDQKIEGILFYKAAPMKKQALCNMLDIKLEELNQALTELSDRLISGGTSLVATDTEVSLGTNPALSTYIEQLRKDDLKNDIGKAGAETLAIILYKGPVGRSEIDRVRGVNSSYILRNLLIRGLVEKVGTGRAIQFQATTDLLQQLGVTDKKTLPNFTTIMNALEAHEQQTMVETN